MIKCSLQKFSLSLFLFVIPFTIFSQTLKFSPAELKEDIDFYQKVMYECHPSIFRYYPKDTLDFYFNRFRKKGEKEMSIVEFEQEAKFILTKLGCIHTSAKKKSLSKRKRKKVAKNKIIPFHFHYDGEQLWTMDALGDSLSIGEWSQVLSIDNNRVDSVVQTLLNYRTADGYVTSYAQQTINSGLNFNYLYAYYFEMDSLVNLNLLNRTGDSLSFDLPIIRYKKKPEKSKTENKPKTEIKKWDKKVKNHFYRIENNTAFLKISSFNPYNIRTKLFYKKLFRALEKQKISNLVIDLRGNGGGDIREAGKLVSYILDEPYSYRLMRKKNRIFKYSSLFSKLAFLGNAFYRLPKKHYRKDGFTSIEYERKATIEYNFGGQVYLLINGYSASSTSFLASYLKHLGQAITIGEETAGGAAGNNGLLYPKIHLPNTDIRITIPYYWLDYKLTKDKGRGVLPDIPIHYTLEDIKAKKDLEMEKVMEILNLK